MDATWLTHWDTSHWLVLALVLLIAELLTGTTYLLWPAVAAGLTGLASLFLATAMLPELAIFAVLTLLLTALGRTLLRDRLLATSAGGHLNRRGAALIGTRGVAQGAFVSGVGSVKLADSVWRALCAEPIAAGQAVEVVSVEGSTVHVKAVGS